MLPHDIKVENKQIGWHTVVSSVRLKIVPNSSGASFVGSHLALVTLLVLRRKLVVLLAFLLGEGLEKLRDDLGNVSEACFGVGLLDGRTVHVGVDEERRLVALGGIGILLLLLLLALTVILAVIAGRDVVFHLPLVPLLVLRSEILPLLLLILRKTLKLLGQDLGNVAELGFWILSLDSLAVCTTIKKKEDKKKS